MRIAWIGGLDRNEGQLESLARGAGHTLEFHTGHTGGNGSMHLRATISRSDFVLIVTDVNSHGAVWRARRLARQRGCLCLLMSRCGPSKFTELLEQLSAEEAPRWANAAR